MERGRSKNTEKSSVLKAVSGKFNVVFPVLVLKKITKLSKNSFI